MTRSWTSWRPALRPRRLSHRSAWAVLQGVQEGFGQSLGSNAEAVPGRPSSM